FSSRRRHTRFSRDWSSDVCSSDLLGGEQSHDRRLDERHERHVAVGGDGDGAEELGGELVGDEDGGGAVGAADDADGGGLLGGEAEHGGAHEGEEQPGLGGGPEEEGARHGDERAEVGERADAEEDERREEFQLYALGDEVVEAAFDLVDLEGLAVGFGRGRDDAVGTDHGRGGDVGLRFHLHAEGGAFIDAVGTEFRGDDAAGGQVGDEGAKGDGDEQQGLKALGDGEPEQDAGDNPHDGHLPGDGLEAGGGEVFEKILEHGAGLDLADAMRGEDLPAAFTGPVLVDAGGVDGGDAVTGAEGGVDDGGDQGDDLRRRAVGGGDRSGRGRRGRHDRAGRRRDGARLGEGGVAALEDRADELEQEPDAAQHQKNDDEAVDLEGDGVAQRRVCGEGGERGGGEVGGKSEERRVGKEGRYGEGSWH